MARVQVSDEVWTAFRVGLGPKPVSVALGELVEREVARQRRRSAGDGESARLALEDARSLTDDLSKLTARLEELAAPAPTISSPSSKVVTEPRLPGVDGDAA